MRPTRPGKLPGPLHYAGDPETRGGFRSYLIEFIDWTQAMHYSATTLKNRRIEMGYFIDWCEERSVTTPHEVTRAMLERYRQYIFAYRRKADCAPLSRQTQSKRLITVRMFFKWMAKSHHLLFNPASEMELPKQENRLPRHVLTVAEIAQVLNAADIDDPSGFGIRDRAMLEALYSTGMRRAELVGLDLNDIDAERGTVLVRLGKGKKDRMVPIGERALAWIARYVQEVRPRYLDDDSDATLFLSKHHERVSAKQMSGIAKKTIDRANLDRVQASGPLNSSCHLFRHACATHMLENGADIRFIQALLGHAELTTTEVYTRVAIMKLKEVHEATHPARLQARGAAHGGTVGVSGVGVRAALLDALDVEAMHQPD
ncbi:site-specific tyrosine recombinase XerC [Massilia pseudoviolaceinigra]|uniref:site-specific tyrosine recombinase XerC n=1 Tax=Massilia pseudoviolaceinigra TaxID=3057165 RepID=UPI002796D498|nr:site-specific tyrosine recombinase XerC [Massilia sp. CCM 9206]MDQ1925115.1 site-specific tyrosine recombinase XerC [Massilia sp. CCM 9206]